MVTIIGTGHPSGGSTALLDTPVINRDDEFALDVRVVVSPQDATMRNNCPTDDGCGQTCQDGASACVSHNNNTF